MDVWQSLAGLWPTNTTDVVKALLILTPSLIGFTILYLQHRRLSPPSAGAGSPSALATTTACAHCRTAKPRSELKQCGKCQDVLYCDAACQRSNWKAHKVVCGQGKGWKGGDLVQVGQGVPEGTTRVALENNMKLWCDFHRRVLIFVTIQALSLATHPSNSTSLLLLISLVFRPPPSPSTPVHRLFELEDASPLDSARFRAMNPGMGTAFVELERMRAEAKSKGAEGVALLLVRCGAVVQVIPVGLPSLEDLKSVQPDRLWKQRLEEVVKAGIKLE